MSSVYVLFSLFTLSYALLYDPKECKTSREGAEYMGMVAVTAGGLECQRWDSQEPHSHTFTDPKLFPDADFEAVANYCRNPDLDSAPWCYTTDPDTRYDFCDIQWCPIYPECDASPDSVSYQGSKSTTKLGQSCKSWDDMSVEQFQYLSINNPDVDWFIDLQENYCRNPDKKTEGPWCYTGEGVDDWEQCVISVCKPSATCLTETTGTSYVGKRGITSSGRPCQRWDRQFPHTHGYNDPEMFPDASVEEAENFCRNPDESRNGVWCYTTDQTQEWEYCDIPQCSDCTHTVDGRGYAGTVAVSQTGAICRNWADYNITNPDLFPDVSIDAAVNYCRNPDNKEGGLWCYIGDTDSQWEHCELPLCQEDCGKDSKERRTHKHVLHIGLDGVHATCWQNAPGGVPNFRRFETEGSYTHAGRGEVFTFSGPNWSSFVCGMGNEETGVVSNNWEAPWMGKSEAITPITGVNYPMPCVFYYLKGIDANIRTASFINWPWIYEMTGRNSPGSTDYDFYCRGTSSSGADCDWDVTYNVSSYIANITSVVPSSYTFIHIDELDRAGHSTSWCSEGYLASVDMVDEMIGVILDAVADQDILVALSTDHGGIAFGHGDATDPEITIPIFYKGRGVKANYQFQGMGRNRNMIPTLVWAMGHPQSPHWYGDVEYEIFE